MFGLTWLAGLIRRRPLRLIGAIAGVALAVTVLGALGAFFAASKAQMTRQSAKGIVVDWQVQLSPGTNQASAARIIAKAPGVVTSLPVSYANTTGLTANAGGTVQTTGAGRGAGRAPLSAAK